MPTELRAHLRYPEDLFKVAGDDVRPLPRDRAARFYDGSAKWLVSPDPGLGRGVERPTSARSIDAGSSDSVARATSRRRRRRPAQRIDPYYLYLQLPEAKTRSTSSSSSRSCRCRRATARRGSCRSSPPTPIPATTGSCASFTMPQGETVQGPVQVNNEIIRTARDLAPRSRCSNQQGSQVIQGSMQLIPVGNSIVYVRPFYVQGRGSGSVPAVPVRRRVLPGLRRGTAARPCRTALDQMLGGPDADRVQRRRAGGRPAPAARSTTTTTTTPGTATTTPADHGADHHDDPAGDRERAGPPQPGGGQARPGRRRRSTEPATSARTRRSSNAGPRPGEAGPAEAGALG